MAFDGFKKFHQLGLVEMAIGANAAADIEAKRTNFTDGFGNIARIQAAREKYRNANRIANHATDAPVVLTASAAKFFYSQFAVTGIEQNGIHVGSDGDGFVHAFAFGHMDDLND